MAASTYLTLMLFQDSQKWALAEGLPLSTSILSYIDLVGGPACSTRLLLDTISHKFDVWCAWFWSVPM